MTSSIPLPRIAFTVVMTAAAVFQSQTLVAHHEILRDAYAISQTEDLLIHQPINLSSTLVHDGQSDATTAFMAARAGPETKSTSLASLEALHDDNTMQLSYEVDDLCGGCRYTTGDRKVSCGKIIIQRFRRDKKITLREAALSEIARHNLTKCRHTCLQCDDHHRVYWRPDHTAPTIKRFVTHYLSSIPYDQHRIPNKVLATHGDENLTRFFAQEPNRYPAKRYLFEYNPSIVPFQTNSYQQELTINGKIPTYVASYRVGTQQSCFPPNVTLQLIGGSWSHRPESISYLAIALLDSDLSVLSDAVFDLPKSFGIREDFRLFNLRGRLYLSSFCKLTPLHIGTKDSPPYSNPTETKPIPYLFQNINASADNQLLLLTMGRDHIFCSNDDRIRSSSKNLNYYVDAQNQTMVELYPMGDLQSKVKPHEVQPVDLTMPTKENPQQRYGKDDIIFDDGTTTPARRRPSFYTLDELEVAHRHGLYESPYVGDRGSACCVEFVNPSQRSSSSSVVSSSQPKLLLGVSHVEIPFGRPKLKKAGLIHNQYLSRFYAMESVAPYRTVARSGYICFSQYSETAAVNTGSSSNPLAQRPLWQKFSIGDLTLDCPAIHFISGMTEKVGDPSTLIIAYGASDCTSWFVEVDKQEVVDLLYGPPKTKHR